MLHIRAQAQWYKLKKAKNNENIVRNKITTLKQISIKIALN